MPDSKDELTYVVELKLEGPFGPVETRSGFMRASEAAMTSTHYKPGDKLTVLVSAVRLRQLTTTDKQE